MASLTLNLIQKIFFLRRKTSFQEQLPSQINKPENILMEIQKILVWDDPFFSCCCIISVNIVFWLIVYLDFKFYGIIFATLSILTFEQLWMELVHKYLHKNDSNSENLASESSTKSYERVFMSFFEKCLIMLKEIYMKARFLRQSQPGMFCMIACVGFFFLGVLGRSFSSVTAFYILLMLIMTVPGVLIRFLPPECIKCIMDLFSSHTDDNNDDEVEPYLPDTSEEALELLSLAGGSKIHEKEDDEGSTDLLLERISDQTSDTAESVCSKLSLYPESVVMLSPENSMDCWDFDLPTGKLEETEIENSGINFQSKHFDGDSSEEEFVKGLDLSEGNGKQLKKKQIQQSNSNLNTEDISASKKSLKTVPKEKNLEKDKESSSDTDSFELISEEDM